MRQKRNSLSSHLRKKAATKKNANEITTETIETFPFVISVHYCLIFHDAILKSKLILVSISFPYKIFLLFFVACYFERKNRFQSKTQAEKGLFLF